MPSMIAPRIDISAGQSRNKVLTVPMPAQRRCPSEPISAPSHCGGVTTPSMQPLQTSVVRYPSCDARRDLNLPNTTLPQMGGKTSGGKVRSGHGGARSPISSLRGQCDPTAIFRAELDALDALQMERSGIPQRAPSPNSHLLNRSRPRLNPASSPARSSSPDAAWQDAGDRSPIPEPEQQNGVLRGRHRPPFLMDAATTTPPLTVHEVRGGGIAIRHLSSCSILADWPYDDFVPAARRCEALRPDSPLKAVLDRISKTSFLTEGEDSVVIDPLYSNAFFSPPKDDGIESSPTGLTAQMDKMRALGITPHLPSRSASVEDREGHLCTSTPACFKGSLGIVASSAGPKEFQCMPPQLR